MMQLPDADSSRAPGARRRTRLQNAAIVLPIAAAQSAVYLLLTYHSFRPVSTLRPTWLDRQIPFVAWTVWPYLGLVVVSIALPILIRNPVVFRGLLRAYVMAILVAFGSYALLPTRVERDPSYRDGPGLSRVAYRMLVSRMGDGASCPSGHILFPLLGSWAWYADRRRGGGLVLLTTLLCSLSILTLKEHVVADWVAGLLVVALAIRVGFGSFSPLPDDDG